MREMNLAFDVPIRHQADVIVVGGGPAGFCAAVAAARTGARTLLVEQAGFCGGMATLGLVAPFMTSYDRDGEIMIIRGLFEEIVERMVERGGAIHPKDVPAGSAFTSYISVGHAHVTPFDSEILRCLMDDMLVESGIQALYHTSFVKPLLSGRRVEGVLLHSKSGLEIAQGKVIVDCTGDGDVAGRAGAPFDLGNPATGQIQPASMFFRIGNVDLSRVDADIQAHLQDFYRENGINYRSFHWRVAQAREKGDWTLDRVSIGMFRGVREDEWSINTSRIMRVDGTDAKSLTAAEMEGRRQAHMIFAFMKKYIPGCENAVLLSTASTVGIRETRHIHGEYTLTADDVLEGLVPEDSILLASNSIDVHGRYGPMSNEYMPIRNGKWYGVPYRCLVPRGVDQLLMAGRCVSATSEASAAIRVMPPCMGLGHAAGAAAAMAAREGSSVREIDVKKLQAILREQNAYLG